MAQKANVLAFPKPFIEPRWNSLEGRNILAKAKQTIEANIKNNSHTRDGALLNKYESDLVFVYGSLKTGFSNNAKLNNAKKVGLGCTKSNSWVMQQVRTARGANFPVIFFSTGDKKGRIAGEIYSVPTTDIFDLDYLESNGVAYKRVKLPVEYAEVVEGVRIVHTLDCWVYHGMKDYWEQFGANLRSISRITPNSTSVDPYYVWQKRLEFNDAGSYTDPQGQAV